MNETLSATAWIKEGDLIIVRTALSYDHPESWWQLWKEKYNEELPYDVALDIFPEITYSEYEYVISGEAIRDFRLAQAENYIF